MKLYLHWSQHDYKWRTFKSLAAPVREVLPLVYPVLFLPTLLFVGLSTDVVTMSEGCRATDTY